MNKLPCEDCITLGICKSFVRTNTDIYSLHKLGEKCSLLKTYILSCDEMITTKNGFYINKSKYEIYSFLCAGDD